VEFQFQPKPKVTPEGGLPRIRLSAETEITPKVTIHFRPKPKVHATYHYRPTHASSHRRLRKQ